MEDYKKRMTLEHAELSTRMKKLNDMLAGYEDGTLGFEPSCSKELLSAQYAAMCAYRAILEERARIEGIEF